MSRTCFGCKKNLVGETAKIVIKNPQNSQEVHVKSFCNFGCAQPYVVNFTNSNICIWCGKSFNVQNCVKGGLGEPYCSKQCYSEAGKAMFYFEMREGNM